jgi:hypothetical protein
MMSSHGGRILAAIAAVVPFVGIHAVSAADFAGSVQGVVKSASGEALPGAYVKLFNPERQLTFMVVSQAQGRYTLNNLPPGNYTVQGVGNGFQSQLTPVTLTADKPASADVSLTDKQGDAVPNGDRGRQVRPMPFPASADPDEVDPRQLDAKNRLDAGTYS